MNKNILYIINGLIAGLLGAALFFAAAFYLHWGGIGQERTTVTIPEPVTAMSRQQQTVATVDGQLTPIQIFDRYADSAVQIVSSFEGDRESVFHPNGEARAIGSGFVTSAEGYILTNAHVVVDVEREDPVKASRVEVNFRNGKTVEASVVGSDLSSDVAVIKVDPAGLDLVLSSLGDSDAVVVGEPVVAIGSPFGLYSSSITAGIVSATDRTVESPEAGFAIQNAIQTDAAINSGNSGGPLFNMRGEVIGLNEQIATVSGGNEGVGFAVPINRAKQVMEQIIATGEVQYAWLGVVGQTVDQDSAEDLELKVEKGALIVEILDGPARSAGLAKGDVIVKIDGQDMDTMEDVTGILITHKPGDRIKLSYVRGSENRETEVELGERPDSF